MLNFICERTKYKVKVCLIHFYAVSLTFINDCSIYNMRKVVRITSFVLIRIKLKTWL